VRLTSRASSDEGTRYAQNTTQAQNGRLLYAGLTLVLFYRIAVARLPLSQWWDIALMLAATTLAWFVLRCSGTIAPSGRAGSPVSSGRALQWWTNGYVGSAHRWMRVCSWFSSAHSAWTLHSGWSTSERP